MINKTQYISISLLVLSILLALVGAVVIHDKITTLIAETTYNLSEMEETSSISYYVIGFLAGQCIIVAFLHALNKNSKSFEKEENIDTNNEIVELKKEELSSQKETTSIQVQFNTVLETIKALSSEKLDKKVFGEKLLSELAGKFKITQGILYEVNSGDSKLHVLSSYAYYKKDSGTLEFGEGLAGQVAKAKRIVNIQSIPSGYIKTVSGLGESTPTNLLICPLLNEGETIGILELASFEEFSKETENQFSLIAQKISEKLNSV